MDGKELFIERIFKYPAQEEYFFKLEIYATDKPGGDKLGKRFLLFLHQDILPEPTRIFYCDKVRVGETLKQAIDRAIYHDFGFSETKEITIDDVYEADYTKDKRLLPRCVVHATIPYQEITKLPFPNIKARWISFNLLSINEAQQMVVRQRISEQEVANIITQLDKLDYFKYVPQNETTMVKEKIKESLATLKTFENFRDNDSSVSLDKRSYLLDPESLAEGGIGDAIQHMKEILEKEGVVIESIKDIAEDIDYDLQINGKTYEIYHGESDDNWSLALKRLLEILNALLTEAGSDERVYLQYEEDARSIFLTEKLYNYMKTLPIAQKSMPTPSNVLGFTEPEDR